METFWNLTAIIGALVFVGLWLDKQAKKMRRKRAGATSQSELEYWLEDDEAEDLRESVRKARASGFRR